MAWRARVPYCLHPLSPQDDEMVTTDSPLCLSNILPVVAAWYLERSVDFGHDALALSLLSFCRNSHNGTLCFATLQYMRPRHGRRRLCSLVLWRRRRRSLGRTLPLRLTPHRNYAAAPLCLWRCFLRDNYIYVEKCSLIQTRRYCFAVLFIE